MDCFTFIGPSRVDDSTLDTLMSVKEIIDYTDPDCCITLSHDKEKTIIHVRPSLLEYKQTIVDNLLWVNKYLNIKVVFSKSLAISSSVSFELENKFGKG